MVCKYLRIGKIVNTQGIKGEVRVIPLTDDIDRFRKLKHVFLDDVKLISMDIEYVKYHKSFVLLKFAGIDNIDEAEKYKDTYILIDRDNAIKLPQDSYFICDIIGLGVEDKDGKSLGVVSDVMSTGSNDIYVVKSDEGEILIPAIKSVVMEINIDEGRVVVDLPEGLV